jgi:hypothetical protein
VEHRIEIALNEYVVGHIVLDEAKGFVPRQVSDVAHLAGRQVVHGDDFVIVCEESVAEM